MAKHWNLAIDDNRVAWLAFDKQGQAVNSLDIAALQELKEYMAELVTQTSLRGIVFYSTKESGFIVGADIHVLSNIEEATQAQAFIQLGQEVFAAIATMPQTTLAVIEGFCMGGGLELALACDYRIAVESDKRILALPEIKLGIFPGWGGSVRLPRLVGVLAAMDLILSGRALTPKAAQKIGILEAVVAKRHLQRAIRHYISKQPHQAHLSYYKRLLSSSLIRPLVAKMLRHKMRQVVNSKHYPAPFAVIDNWERFGAQGAAAYAAELEQVTELAQTDTARNLLRVFQLQNNLKEQAKNANVTFQHVHIIGAGVMGGDIAAWCALKGLKVSLQDTNTAALARTKQRAYNLYYKKLKKPRLVQAALDRLIPDLNGDGLSMADVVIEAIFEDCEAKQSLFEHIETKAKSTAILATNTSSILLRDIAKHMQDPSRLVGIHFFNPVSHMPLIEVVSEENTAASVLITAQAFVKRIDKLPLVVSSQAGFLVNRILMAYMMEAVTMVAEGLPLTAIDKAATDFGMPMGPIELADTVGLDICLSVAKILQQSYGGDIPQCLADKVNQKYLGRKSGQGFYQYKKSKVKKPKLAKDFTKLAVIQQRLLWRYLNESVACLNEGVVSCVDEIDAGMIFGTGFAPFRGGPLHYARAQGFRAIEQQFLELTEQCGERFKMHEGWSQLFAAD